MKTVRRLLPKLLMTGITLLFVLFIFSNSMADGTHSGSRSAWVVQLLQSVFDRLGIHLTISELFLRKLAHFLEYLALGLLLGGTIRAFTKNWWARIFAPLFFGLLIPVLDEGLQLLIPGRSGEVRDVLLDFSGVLLGLLIITPLLFFILDRKGAKRSRPDS